MIPGSRVEEANLFERGTGATVDVVCLRTGDVRAAEELMTRCDPMIQRLARLGLVEPSSNRQLHAVRGGHRRLEPVDLKDGEIAGQREPLARALGCVAHEIRRDGSDAP